MDLGGGKPGPTIIQDYLISGLAYIHKALNRRWGRLRITKQLRSGAVAPGFGSYDRFDIFAIALGCCYWHSCFAGVKDVAARL